VHGPRVVEANSGADDDPGGAEHIVLAAERRDALLDSRPVHLHERRGECDG
jgi:hypothetical protein